MIKPEICDPSVSGTNNEITSQVTIDSGFDLDNFLYLTMVLPISTEN